MSIPFRRVLLIISTLALATGAYSCAQLGQFLAREDPLSTADAVFVFAGSKAERQVEAADLFNAGYAPVVVITRATDEEALGELARRGIAMRSEHEITMELMGKLGVPPEKTLVPPRIHDNTAQEAETLRQLAATHGWRRVILVSSKYHMRRINLSARRALRGTSVAIVLRPSRHDPATPARWWRRRSDIRQILWELPKLVGYAVGVGE